MNIEENFTEGSIFLPLIRFTYPIFLAILLQTTYGAVDLLIVGRFSTAAEVSAVSTGSWILQTFTLFITGLSMGTTILLGQLIGQNKHDKCGDVIGNSIILFIVVGSILTFLLILCAPTFSYFMKTPDEAKTSTIHYTRICSAGILFILSYNIFGSILRGLGNSKLPLISVAIACVINIIGDIFFVMTLKMGAKGAAISTVLSQGISVIISLIIIKHTKFPFSFSGKDIRWNWKYVKSIIWLGLPIAFQDILISFSFLVVTAIVNSLGVIVSAGVGIAEKICGFIMLIPSAYMQAMSAFSAQNFGAGKSYRAKKALLYAISSSLLVGVQIAYLSLFHGQVLAQIFSGDPTIVVVASEYLKAYSIDCLLISFLFCFVGYFNGCGKTTFVMVQGIIGAFLVRIPISYIMSKQSPVSIFNIGLATPSIVYNSVCKLEIKGA